MKNATKSRPLRIILASGSPRRHEMLRALNVDFEALIPDVIERWNSKKNARKIAVELAIRKVQKCEKRDALVIAMDTLVVIDGHKLGKPKNTREARNMLNLLSGRTHRVVTGVALLWQGRLHSSAAVTKVRFRKISSHEIDWYLQKEEPWDKAGAYAIQGLARIFIDSIDGCYYNVVGFPLALFQRMLRKWKLTILDLQQTEDSED